LKIAKVTDKHKDMPKVRRQLKILMYYINKLGILQTLATELSNADDEYT